jgi:predicted DNA-binding protein
MTTVQIPDEIAHEVEAWARAAGTDAETFVREAIIARLEDLEDVRIAEERLADPQPTYSLDEVKRHFGLGD